MVSRGQQRTPETLRLRNAESVQDTSHLGQQNGPLHGGAGAFLLLQSVSGQAGFVAAVIWFCIAKARTKPRAHC